MIRNFEEKDIESAMRIIEESPIKWSEKFFYEILKDDTSFIFSLVQEGELSAFIIYKILYDEADILILAVKKSERRKGYAKELIQFAIKDLSDRGIKNISLEVRVSNKAAITLYEKFMFKIKGRRKEYYYDKEDAYIMRRCEDETFGNRNIM